MNTVEYNSSEIEKRKIMKRKETKRNGKEGGKAGKVGNGFYCRVWKKFLVMPSCLRRLRQRILGFNNVEITKASNTNVFNYFL